MKPTGLLLLRERDKHDVIIVVMKSFRLHRLGQRERERDHPPDEGEATELKRVVLPLVAYYPLGVVL